MKENNQPQLTPIADNLRAALQTWWKNLKKFVLIYCWGLLFSLMSLAVVFIFLGLDHWVGQNNLPLHILAILLAVLGTLAAIYFYIRTYISMFLLVKKNYAGEEFSIFKESGQYFWPYLGLAVLTFVFVLLWCLLLIIPGIIYSVFYSFAVYAFFFEDRRGLKAIRRSVQLVSTYWWPVFWRYVVITLALWAVMLIITIPLHFSSVDSAFSQVWRMIMQVVEFLIGPIVMIYSYNIYQDLVKIKK
jgi:hypothetical protein